MYTANASFFIFCIHFRICACNNEWDFSGRSQVCFRTIESRYLLGGAFEQHTTSSLDECRFARTILTLCFILAFSGKLSSRNSWWMRLPAHHEGFDMGFPQNFLNMRLSSMLYLFHLHNIAFVGSINDFFTTAPLENWLELKPLIKKTLNR